MKPTKQEQQTIQVKKNTDFEITKAGNYVFKITQPDVNLKIFSALRAEGNDVLELNVVIHHLVGRTVANTILKAVGFDQSQIIIKAKILIDENCPQTESFLTERVLLASPQAHALAVPDLEILTDDVRCSHAASVTKIPEEQIFYLMSRGVSRRTAEEMIVKGFLLKSD